MVASTERIAGMEKLLERADRLVASNEAISSNSELLYGALINIYNELQEFREAIKELATAVRESNS